MDTDSKKERYERHETAQIFGSDYHKRNYKMRLLLERKAFRAVSIPYSFSAGIRPQNNRILAERA